jgi:hypothetical protein
MVCGLLDSQLCSPNFCFSHCCVKESSFEDLIEVGAASLISRTDKLILDRAGEVVRLCLDDVVNDI